MLEEGKRYADAAKFYKQATTEETPPELKIESYRRLASVLQNKELNKPEEAELAIEKMVQSDPTNYKVYLERTRYRREVYRNRLRDRRTLSLAGDEADLKKAEDDLKKSGADLTKAMELAEREPEVYLEMAKEVYPELVDDAITGERKEDRAARESRARQILETGLEKRPSSAALYKMLQNLYLRSGRPDQAIATLERGLSKPAETTQSSQDGRKPDDSLERIELLRQLASLLAYRGETGKLLLRIKELETAGDQPLFLNYLNAYYNVNTKDFGKAKELLLPLDANSNLTPEFKKLIKALLARCYDKLDDPTKQEDSLKQILAANPQDLPAKRGLINMMDRRGDVEGAINEYKSIAKQSPDVLTAPDRLNLAMLLIKRNRQRSKLHPDWSEVTTLINDAEKALPDSIEPVILRAELYMAQENPAAAHDILEKSRPRFLKNVAFWSAKASLLTAQKQFDAALTLLEEAKTQLGDKVEIRLQRRSWLWPREDPRLPQN